MNTDNKSHNPLDLLRCLSAIFLLTLLLVVLSQANAQTASREALSKATPLAIRGNGKIAFIAYNNELYVMNSDGSQQMLFPNVNSAALKPTWSPNGDKLAFVEGFGTSLLKVMNADGSNQTTLTSINSQGMIAQSISWSPDGKKIAFASAGDIFAIDIDTRGLVQLTGHPEEEGEPEWSPDGSKIAFTRVLPNPAGYIQSIHIMNADGSNARLYSEVLAFDHTTSPKWSPDGQRLAFVYANFYDGPGIGSLVSGNESGTQFVGHVGCCASSFDWSPDGTRLILRYFGPGYPQGIYSMTAGGGSLIPLVLGERVGSPDWQPLVPVTACDNPIDCPEFFIRQHYVDFLNREPDPAGDAGWQEILDNCPTADTTCDRIHVSSAFFRSPEFQGRGYFVYRFYPVSFGRKPDYDEFTPDLAKVSGFLTDAELEAAKLNFIAEFMNRPAFVTRFNGLDNTQYVDTLLSTSGVTHLRRDSWIAALTNGSKTRARVLREIAESTEVYNKYYNQAFVVMQYFGYLRRQPDALYLTWISHLDATGDYRSMIHGFMNSIEYRARFGP